MRLVTDHRGDARLDQLTALVAPFGLLEGEQREAVAALPFVPVRQPAAGGDDVTRPHPDAERVDLAAVQDVAAPLDLLARQRPGRLGLAVPDRPGEGIEVLRGHDAAPSRGLRVLRIPVQAGRRLRPVDRDGPLPDVGFGHRIGDGFLPPDAFLLLHLGSDEGIDFGHGGPLLQSSATAG